MENILFHNLNRREKWHIEEIMVIEGKENLILVENQQKLLLLNNVVN